MNCKELFLIERIDQLIKLKTKENSLNFPKKLIITERHAFNITNKMKDVYKAPIDFDKDCNSHIYGNRQNTNWASQRNFTIKQFKKIWYKKLSLKFYFTESI